ADAHRLRRTGVLVAEGGRAADTEDIAGHPVVAVADRGGGRAVVHLVLAGGRDGQRPAGDVGRGRRRGAREGVVAGVGAAQRDAAHAHRLARAGILVGKGGRTADAEGIAGHTVVAIADGGGRRAVVDLALATGRDVQRAGRDVRGRGGGRRGQGVV